ncbi:MAG: AAA family ATPase [Ardenticatenaceae bacterium]|nr:AAA family ATPase [Ardenticatenaceae bacterium]
MELRVYTFGGARFEQNGKPLLKTGSRKMQALFLYVVCCQRVVTREELQELLWSHMPPKQALANLRRELTGMRKAFGRYVTIADGKIWLTDADKIWVDGLHLDKTKQQLTSRPLNGRSAPQLETLLNLYSGDFLAGFQVREAEGFERWLQTEREHWRQRVIAVLELLTLFSLSQQILAHEKSIAYLRRLLQLDPLRESAHRHLMQLLAATNQRSEALKQYELCRKLLWEELGVSPEAETDALFAAIYDGRLSEVPLPKTAVIPHALPASTTPFVGREAELQQLTTLLGNSSSRLITILGPGGMGKTRLALAAAQTQLERSTLSHAIAFADGIYFVPLARIQTVDGVVPAIAQTLDLQVDNDSPLKRQLITFLRRKRMLLVLDNIEHLLGMAPLVHELLQASPHLRLLLTSRQRLNQQGEHLLLLDGMAFPAEPNPANPHRYRPAELELFESVQLFLQAARQLQPTLALTNENQGHISQICQLAAGMPLGIVLAASWLDTLTLPQVVGEIRRSLDFLTADMEDLPPRQRSLRAAFLASWRLLTPQQQELLPQLAFFQGGFTLEAAQAVTGATATDLRQLMHKSLLSRNEAGRFEIHELVRQFAVEKLAEVSNDVANRHAAYFCHKIVEWTPLLRGPEQQPVVLAIEADFDNILLTWHISVQHQDPNELLTAFENLEQYCSWRLRQEAFVNILFPALDQLQHAQTPQQKRLLLLLHNFATLYSDDNQYHASIAAALLAELEIMGADIREQKAQHLLFQGHMSSHFANQLDFYEESLALYRALGNWWHIGMTLLAVNTAAAFSLNIRKAEVAIAEARQIFEKMGDPRGLGRTYELMVNLYTFTHPPEEMALVEQHARRCYEIRQQLGIVTFDASAMIQSAFTLGAQGRYEEMLQFVDRGLELIEAQGFDKSLGIASLFAWDLLHVGQYERARQMAEQALLVAQEAAAKGWGWLALGDVALVFAKRDDARHFYQKAFACLQEIGEISSEMWNGSGWIMAHGTLKAVAYMTQQNVNLGTRGLWHRLPATAAFVFLQHGDAERAIEYYTVSERYPAITNSCWWQDMVGKRIAAAKRELPAALVQRAEERGRGMEIETAVLQLCTLH